MTRTPPEVQAAMYCPWCGVPMDLYQGPEVDEKTTAPPFVTLKRRYQCPVCKERRTSFERLTYGSTVRALKLKARRPRGG